MLTLIVARARNGAIGRDGTIPWTKPEDLRLFQRETLGGAVIMGRRTWESLPSAPLKNRLNIVVSRDAGLAEHVCPSPEAALELARSEGRFRIHGIGGSAIYEGLLPLADRLLITEVDRDVEGADAFFPDFDEAAWRELHRQPLGGEGPDCMARELLRR
ncbi:dihydrofolate reductase [Pseudoroseicyclus aestuarii]|uniref:Dihydrofolate reductase n=1 Tax=Pseudoroseicyclus aestuarii TaxID=1795041 RepID=A0A318SRX4_9RHOB|nr:dihydrofolate reductase [Pseudoroseicyclus aestuarii]PYE84443.1 dihydrofolate reductase [Pseudoroseicyclus aestuarii]